MAIFNPTPQTSNDPNYLGYSQGTDRAQVSRTYENLFHGLTEVASAAPKAIDDVIKHKIKEDVRGSLEAVRDSFGVKAAAEAPGNITGVKGDPSNYRDGEEGGGSLVAGAKGPVKGAPPGVQKLGNRLESLQSAYQNGELSESYYWSRMESVVRQMRSQYKGYEDYIDERVANILGTTPANALRRALLNDMDMAEKAQQRALSDDQKFIRQNAAHLPPDYYTREREGRPYSMRQVEAYVAVQKQEENRISTLRSKYALDKDHKEARAGDAERLAETHLDHIYNTFVTRAAQAGGIGSVRELSEKIQQKLASGKPPTPEEQQQLKSAFAQLKQELSTRVDEALHRPFSKDKPDTYATDIKDQGKLKALKDNILSRLDQMEKNIMDEKYGLVGMNLALSNSMRNETLRQTLQSHSIFKKLDALRAIGGEKLIELLMMPREGADSPILKDTLQGLRTLDAAELATGQGNPSQQLDRRINAGKNDPGLKDPKGVVTFINDQAMMLKNKDVPDKIAENAAKSIFSAANRDFLTKLQPADRMKAFTILASPEAAERVRQLSRINPEIGQLYHQWVAHSSVGLFKAEIDTVSNEITDPHSVVKLTFDPGASQFVASPREGYEKELREMQARGHNPLNITTGINRVLKTFEASLDPSANKQEEVLKFLKGIGADPNAPKREGFWPALWEAVKKGWDYLGQDEGKAFSPSSGVPPGAPEKVPGKSSGLGGSEVAHPTEYALEDSLGAPGANGKATRVFRADGDRRGVEGVEMVSLTGGPDQEILDRTEPLRELIGKAETGGTNGYNRVFGSTKNYPLTDMSVDEVLAFQGRMVRSGSPSTAAGKYQILRSTLAELKKEMGLTGDEQFTAELQDQMAVALLRRRGLDKFLAGEMNRKEFTNRLAMEWAGLPNTTGSSHYAGDGLNKATVKLRDVLDVVKQMEAEAS